jgi:hypothetical protein
MKQSLCCDPEANVIIKPIIFEALVERCGDANKILSKPAGFIVLLAPMGSLYLGTSGFVFKVHHVASQHVTLCNRTLYTTMLDIMA